MSKKRELKTLEDLRVATLAIVPADSGHETEARASKHVVTAQEQSYRSTSKFYSTRLCWLLPQDRGGRLTAIGTGDTMQAALDSCHNDLRKELEERGRKRRLAATPAAPVRALPAPAPKCLEYQP